MRLNYFLLIALTVAVTLQIAGQSVTGGSTRDRGIALIQQDRIEEGIKLLKAAIKEDKRDIRAWHWLAIALEKAQKPGDAAKAHETAAKTAGELQSSAMDSLQSLTVTELNEAADSAERFAALTPSLSETKRKEWRNRADFLRFQAAKPSSDSRIYKSSEVTSIARVLRKPEPSYTGEARNNQVTGTVVLRCTFDADGHVRNIHVIRGLPDGLTERAIAAARQIKFIPAMKDGKPVSMWMQLEYNFNLY